MTLTEYLQTLGDTAASQLLGFKPSRIKSWRLGQREPRPADARTIIEKTGGRLGWDDIYPPPPAPELAPAEAELRE